MRLRLTRERESRGWSKAELARQTGMHPSTIGLIENRRMTPYPAQVAKLAKALGFPETEADRLLEEVESEPVTA